MVLETGTDHFVGQVLKFHRDMRRYTVRAMSSRYLICTRANSLHGSRKHVVYTVVDLQEGMRGSIETERPHFEMLGSAVCYEFPYDLHSDEGCWELLTAIENGDVVISDRNQIMSVVMWES